MNARHAEYCKACKLYAQNTEEGYDDVYYFTLGVNMKRV